MTKIVDLSSGRDLEEVEADKKRFKEEEEQLFTDDALNFLDSFRHMVDKGELESLCIVGTTKEGAVKTVPLHKNPTSLHKLQFVVEEAKLDIHESIAESYGYRDYQFIEE